MVLSTWNVYYLYSNTFHICICCLIRTSWVSLTIQNNSTYELMVEEWIQCEWTIRFGVHPNVNFQTCETCFVPVNNYTEHNHWSKSFVLRVRRLTGMSSSKKSAQWRVARFALCVETPFTILYSSIVHNKYYSELLN